MSMLWYRVVAAAPPLVAREYAAQGEATTLEGTILFNGLCAVNRAGRYEATLGTE